MIRTKYIFFTNISFHRYLKLSFEICVISTLKEPYAIIVCVKESLKTVQNWAWFDLWAPCIQEFHSDYIEVWFSNTNFFCDFCNFKMKEVKMQCSCVRLQAIVAKKPQISIEDLQWIEINRVWIYKKWWKNCHISSAHKYWKEYQFRLPTVCH